MAPKPSTSNKRARTEAENAATLLQPGNLHKWLKFMGVDTATKNEWNERLLELRGKQFEVAKNLDWEKLSDVLEDRLQECITQVYELDGYRIESSAWETLLNMRAAIYMELCLEFFSTYKLKVDCTQWADPYYLTFRLGGVSRNLSLIEFATRMGLYTEEQVTSPIFSAYLDACVRLPTRRFDAQATWDTIGNGMFRPSTTPAGMLHDPFLRLVQKLLSYSITHRSNGRDKIKKNELWFMAHLSDPQRMVNVPYALAHFLTKASGQRSESAICGGHYITILADSFHILSQTARRDLRVVAQEMRYIDQGELKGAGVFEQPQGQAAGDDTEYEDDDAAPAVHAQGRSRPTIQTLHQEIQTLHRDFHDLHLDEENRQRDMRAMQNRVEAMQYSQDWVQHNLQRWFEATPGFHATPYQPPPYDRSGYDTGGASSSHPHGSSPPHDFGD